MVKRAYLVVDSFNNVIALFNEERLNKIYEWIKYAKNKYAEEEQLKWI